MRQTGYFASDDTLDSRDKKVFISWSKSCAKKVAENLSNTIKKHFGEHRVFFSDASIQCGDRWYSEIEKGINSSWLCIVIATRQNINSDWLMYEAGAMAMSGKRVCVLNLDRPSSGLATNPLSVFHNINTLTEESLAELFSVIVEYYNQDIWTDSGIKTMGTMYATECWPALNSIMQEIADDPNCKEEAKRAKSGWKVTNQFVLSANPDDYKLNKELCLSQIPRALQESLSHMVPGEYLLKLKNNKDEFECERVVVNGARFSTFVAIVFKKKDAKRHKILVFERGKSKKIKVANNKTDVFGSVCFDCGSLLAKIKDIYVSKKDKNNNEDKLLEEMKPDGIEPIPYLAIEDSEGEINTNEKMTVVMFGFLLTIEVDGKEIFNMETFENSIENSSDLALKTVKDIEHSVNLTSKCQAALNAVKKGYIQ